MSVMDPQRLATAEQLASRDYAVLISKDKLTNGQTVFLLEHPELDGCMAQGATFDEAAAELKDATIEFIYYLLEDGFEIPEPLASETVTSLNDLNSPSTVILEKSPYKPGGNLNEKDLENAFNNVIQPDNRKNSMRFSVVSRS